MLPRDDGAARHLPGRTLPSLSFQATDGSHIQLDEVSPGRWVLFLYGGVQAPGGAPEHPETTPRWRRPSSGHAQPGICRCRPGLPARCRY